MKRFKSQALQCCNEALLVCLSGLCPMHLDDESCPLPNVLTSPERMVYSHLHVENFEPQSSCDVVPLFSFVTCLPQRT